jgi:hypothetical protein
MVEAEVVAAAKREATAKPVEAPPQSASISMPVEQAKDGADVTKIEMPRDIANLRNDDRTLMSTGVPPSSKPTCPAGFEAKRIKNNKTLYIYNDPWKTIYRQS